jgi:hypothetical protein
MRIVIEGKVLVAHMRTVAAICRIVSDSAFGYSYIVLADDGLPGGENDADLIAAFEGEYMECVPAGWMADLGLSTTVTDYLRLRIQTAAKEKQKKNRQTKFKDHAAKAFLAIRKYKSDGLQM